MTAVPMPVSHILKVKSSINVSQVPFLRILAVAVLLQLLLSEWFSHSTPAVQKVAATNSNIIPFNADAWCTHAETQILVGVDCKKEFELETGLDLQSTLDANPGAFVDATVTDDPSPLFKFQRHRHAHGAGSPDIGLPRVWSRPDNGWSRYCHLYPELCASFRSSAQDPKQIGSSGVSRVIKAAGGSYRSPQLGPVQVTCLHELVRRHACRARGISNAKEAHHRSGSTLSSDVLIADSSKATDDSVSISAQSVVESVAWPYCNCSQTSINVSNPSGFVAQCSALCFFVDRRHPSNKTMRSLGWGNASIPVCAWGGLQCDNELSTIIGISIGIGGDGLVFDLNLGFPSLLSFTNLTTFSLRKSLIGLNCSQLQSVIPLSGLSSLTLSDSPLTGVLDNVVYSLLAPTIRSVDLSTSLIASDLAGWGLCIGLRELRLNNAVATVGLLANVETLINLEVLRLDDCWLVSGVFPSFAAFRSLREIYLDNTGVRGQLPDLSHLHATLERISLTATGLSGPMPTLRLPKLVRMEFPQTTMSGDVLSALSECTALERLDASFVPNIGLDLDAVCRHWPNITLLSLRSPDLTIMCGNIASVVGSCKKLTELICSGCGLSEPFPAFAAEVQPNILTIDLSDNEISRPSDTTPWLLNMPKLASLKLARTRIGVMPTIRSKVLEVLDISYASLSGNLPDVSDLPFAGSLQLLDLAGNELNGSIPPEYGTSFWNMEYLRLSQNRLTGPIPTFNLAPNLHFLLLRSNRLNGSLPIIFASLLVGLDLGDNDLEGPLEFPSGSLMPVLFDLHVESNRLTCPTQPLQSSSSLLRLVVSRNNFQKQCNQSTFLDEHTMTSLLRFDGSDNEFSGSLPPNLPPALKSLTCARCAIVSDIPAPWKLHGLESLDLSSNAITGLASLLPISLVTLNMANCNLTTLFFSIDQRDLFTSPHWYATSGLQEVNVDDNNIRGSLQSDLFNQQLDAFSPFRSLRKFSAARNRITGSIPEASVGTLTHIDLSGNLLSGSIPASLGNLVQLQSLNLQGNPNLTAPSWQTGQSPVTLLPPFIQIQPLAPRPPEYVTQTFSCPGLALRHSPLASSVFLDLNYTHTALCSCADGYFGIGTQCFRCPDECACNGAIIRGCFPTVIWKNPIETQRVLEPDAITDILFDACTTSTSGEVLCNPEGAVWPEFTQWVYAHNARGIGAVNLYNEQQSASHDNSRMPTGPNVGPSSSPPRLSSPSSRRTGIISSQTPVAPPLDLSSFCLAGHTDRLCSRCQSDFYPSGRDCLQCVGKGSRWAVIGGCTIVAVIICVLLYCGTEMPEIGSGEDPSSYEKMDDNGSGAADADSSLPRYNFLKILLFHLQQLGLLLQIRVALPSKLIDILGWARAGGGAISPMAWFQIGCVLSDDSNSQMWFSFGTVIFVSVAALFIAGPCFQLRWIQQWLSTSTVWRLLGLCLSLFYLLALPLAERALLSFGCTKHKYLNLAPWIACDAHWRNNILAPAIIVILFVVVGCIAAYCQGKHVGGPSPEGGWRSVFGSMVRPYKPERWYWEHVLVARRLVLVLIVSMAPVQSITGTILFLLALHVAGLLQLKLAPYENFASQFAEMMSLGAIGANFLLPIAIKARSFSDAIPDEEDGWVWALFIANAIIIIALGVATVWEYRRRCTCRGKCRGTANGNVQ